MLSKTFIMLLLATIMVNEVICITGQSQVIESLVGSGKREVVSILFNSAYDWWILGILFF